MTHSKLITKVFFLAFTILLYSCDTILSSSSKADSWYQSYSGKVGNQEIVLHLSKASNYNGYMWFKDTQYPVMVYSDPTITIKGDSIYLNGGNANLWITLKGILKENISGEMAIQIDGVQDPVEKVNLSRDDSFTNFLYGYAKGNATLPVKLKNESTYECFMGTILPLEGDVLGDRIKPHLKELLGMPPSDTDIIGWLDSLQRTRLHKWNAEGNKLKPEDAEMMGMSFSEKVLNLLSVMYENDKTITLANYVYAYEGGAHGNYSTSILNIDKTTGEKLLLKDILSREGIKTLPDLLDKAARKQYRIRNNKSLEDSGFFTNTLEPGENFYITSKGIGFYYAPYEIKPFSDGEINLFVPKESLKDYWIK